MSGRWAEEELRTAACPEPWAFYRHPLAEVASTAHCERHGRFIGWLQECGMLQGGVNQAALRYSDRVVTYGELEAAAGALAAGLLESDIAPGERLALFMPNCPELVIAYLACFAAGVIAVPLNTRYRAPEVSYAVERSGAVAMSVHPELAPEAGPIPKRQWVIGKHGPWSQALRTAARTLPDVDPGSPALILFTSGSTALPKGVTHTHASMKHTVTVQAEVQALRADDVNLITLATCHVAGLFGQLLPTLATGGTCVSTSSLRR